jgi:hypothetical protein
MSKPVKWILVVLSPIVLVLCLLSFGNSQWGKYFYMWQAYVFPAPDIEVHPNKVAEDYNGLWRCWDQAGELCHQIQYKNGEAFVYEEFFGKSLVAKNYYIGEDYFETTRMFYAPGRCSTFKGLKNAELDGFQISYFEDGKTKSLSKYVDGQLSGFVMEYLESGSPFIIVRVRPNGEQVLVYSILEKTDNRPRYEKPLIDFAKELTAFEKEQDIH